MKNIAVFASGSGSNFIKINENIINNNINGKIKVLISNNPRCDAVEYAIKNNINFKIINNHRYPEKKIKDKEYQNILSKSEIDLILLAGFMKKIPFSIIENFKNKIMNIHPSILPSFGGPGFYGIKVHEAVIESGNKLTGATVHFVDEEYDRGPIIFQKSIDVLSDDGPTDLSKKVLKIEHEIYSKVVKYYCENKIKIIKDKVVISE